MQQINFKKFKYWQLQYELIHEKGLTYQQGAVYAYLYNHCVNINQNGYCGYSDEKMAVEMKLQYRTFTRELKVLKDKGLIVIKNPQKRSKKSGESRMIYINTDHYLVETQMTLNDIEKQNLKKQLNSAAKRITELEEILSQQRHKDTPNTSYFGTLAVKSGFIPEDAYMANLSAINGYFDCLAKHTDPFWTKRAINYFAKVSKGSQIKCYVSYLEKCVTDSILTYEMEQKHQQLELEFGADGLTPIKK